MTASKTTAKIADAPGRFIEEAIAEFVRTSPLNRVPQSKKRPMFDAPLVAFADGDDPIFVEFKKVVDATHLTPREALARVNQVPKADAQISVVSWILPIARSIRRANSERKLTPSPFWSFARYYGEKFNDALRAHVVNLLKDEGYLSVAPVLESFFARTETKQNPDRYYSNWSERHIAYAAGLGTFSLSDGLITEAGVAHRCGSVVTGLALPISPRTAAGAFANCLFYVNGKCKACIIRCPGEAISEKGHDKQKCVAYMQSKLAALVAKYKVEPAGCGLCQTGVPCESRNPVKRQKKVG